jgi:metal-sulfur cluster biosynthetic enzyme
MKLLTHDSVLAALEQVYDPELDESLVRLEFIDEVHIDGGAVTVRYKVPTYWCAPNFVFMMSDDIRRAVLALPGVTSVTVLVRNNCAEREVNAGVNAGRSFEQTFGADASGEGLDALRLKFLHKGFLARQDVLLRRLRQAGLSDAESIALRVGDLVVDGEDVYVQAGTGPVRVRLAAGDLEKYLRKRGVLALAIAPEAALFTTMDGTPLSAVDLVDYLRRSRGARLNIAFNTSLCEGLLRATYTPERISDTSSAGDALLLEAKGLL